MVLLAGLTSGAAMAEDVPINRLMQNIYHFSNFHPSLFERSSLRLRGNKEIAACAMQILSVAGDLCSKQKDYCANVPNLFGGPPAECLAISPSCSAGLWADSLLKVVEGTSWCGTLSGAILCEFEATPFLGRCDDECQSKMIQSMQDTVFSQLSACK